MGCKGLCLAQNGIEGEQEGGVAPEIYGLKGFCEGAGPNAFDNVLGFVLFVSEIRVTMLDERRRSLSSSSFSSSLSTELLMSSTSPQATRIPPPPSPLQDCSGQ